MGGGENGLMEIFPKNNKGQGLSTNAIVLIILGVLVMAMLIAGFSTGWSAFKSKLSPTNVDNTIEDCQTTCGLNQKYSFCSAERTLRINEEKFEVKTSCAVLATLPNFKKYGIEDCPSVSCDLTCDQIVIDGKTGQTEIETGKYNVSALTNSSCFIN